jgi:hypothetical protein
VRRISKWLVLPAVVMVAVVVIALVALTGSGSAKKHHTAWRALRNCLTGQAHFAVATTHGGLHYVVSTSSGAKVATILKYKDAQRAAKHAAGAKDETAIGHVVYKLSPHATGADGTAIRNCAQQAYH